MKISFENANNTRNVDKVTTSQESTKTQGSGIQSAFALDISGTVMDNSAYGGQGKTAEGVMQNAEQQNYMAAQQKLMTLMSHFMSEEDYQELAKNGFDPKDVDAETIVTVVDEIKTKLAEAGIEIEGYNDDLSAGELARVTGSQSRGQAIAQKLRENDMPVTKENVAEAEQALEASEQITELSEGAKKYLVTNDSALTIENVYKAQFSTNTDSNRQGYGYYAVDSLGHYAKKADNIDWSHLEKQMEKVIEDAGSEVTEQTMEEARWLIEKGIPLTVDSFSKMAEIDRISFPVQEEALLDSIMNAFVSGKSANSALLSNTEPVYEQAKRFLEETTAITDEAVQRVVQEGKPLNLKNLVQADAVQVQVQVSGEESLEMITARRQLEEVRLAMTIEANLKLIKSGYAIDTTDLERLVQDLRAVEAEKQQVLFQTNDSAELAARQTQYEQTREIVAAIPSMPVQVLGKVANVPTLFHLEYMQTESMALQSQYEAAGETYEALMTAPRADLGDSIRKAFRNVDELLDELQLEPEEANRRAVRILGYNRMEVTEENLTAVKDADLALQRVVDRLTPAATLQMIRDGVNPLTMNIKELDAYLQEQVTPEQEVEKYSEYLVRLEQNKEITAEEKEAYIGIYRLLRQVEKSDGAVIGNLVNQGAELSMKNLMTAVRSRKNTNIDYKVDDSFGERVTASVDNSITSQIQSYYERLVTDGYEQLGEWKPGMQAGTQTGMQDMAVEEEEKQHTRQQIEELRQVQQVSEDTIQTLLENDITVTVNNLFAADALLQNRGSLFRQIMSRANENGTEDEQSMEEAVEGLIEHMTDEESAVSAYENLVQVSRDVIEKAVDLSERAIDIRSISNFHKQLNIATKLAKNERFEVPIELNGEKTSINLQIIHQEEAKGQVQVTFATQELGSVSAQFEVRYREAEDEKSQMSEMLQVSELSQKPQINGMVVTGRSEGLEYMQAMDEALQQAFLGAGCQPEKIYYTSSDKLDINQSRVSNDKSDTNQSQSSSGEKSVTNNTLYRVAKTFLTVISRQEGWIQSENQL